MTQGSMGEQRQSWGITPDGSTAESFRIESGTLQLEVLSYGARVTALWVPDRDGNHGTVVLGHRALAPYLEDKAFLGCSIGRYSNRIAGGRFSLQGRPYLLNVNDATNTLHGGAHGFWQKNWTPRALPDGVEFTLTSEDGDQGFPGTLTVVARYRVSGNQITLEYEATTDQATVVNLTNHAYFNLRGEGSASVLGHEVQIEADEYLPVNATAIPLGEPASVEGTAFDFRAPQVLGGRIHEGDAQLVTAHGYDHNFVLRRRDGSLQNAATVVEPHTGRCLSIATTEPGVQLYSGNFLDGSAMGRSGEPYRWRSALCLETQHWPDSPNHPEYPSTVLRPGETFRSSTVWTFSTI